MHGHLAPRVEVAEHHVEGDPYEREPAGPVVAAKHEGAADDCQDPDELHQEDIVGKWVEGFDVSGMVDEADGAGGDEDPAEDGHRDGTFGH